jgi:Beta-propeller repeat
VLVVRSPSEDVVSDLSDAGVVMMLTDDRPRMLHGDRTGDAGGCGRTRRGSRSLRSFAALVAGLALVVSAVGAWGTARQTAAAPVPGDELDGRPLPDLPVSFLENRGQTDPEVRFHAQGPDHAFFLTRDRLVMSLGEDGGDWLVIALRFLGADPDVEPQGLERTGGRTNVLRGDDPAGWRTGLPAFSRIVYPELWPGIDMVFHGTGGQLKYEFHLRPGADPADIRLGYDGADGLLVDPSGELQIATALGELRDSAPVSYQEIGGARVHVESRYVVGQGAEYGFALGDYHPDRELVIDPALQYSTFLGGSSMDRAEDMVVDSSGNVVVVGVTQSTTFPTTTGAVRRTFGGGIMDAFVAKLTPDGTGLVYATYLGGTPTPTRRGNTDNVEIARSVAVDGNGNAYVTGQTDSGNFPTTSGAFQRTLKVGEQQATDGFVTKLGPTGSLVYSTFLGGSAGRDDGREIAVDANGNAYVAGSTFSSDFPTTSGGFDRSHAGGEDVFLTKLNASGSALAYSTLLGGTDNELSHGLAVDGAGNAYVSGATRSTNFPSTPAAFQRTHSGGGFADLFEAFVTKVDPAGASLVYSTFLGGSRVDHGGELAVDPGGNVHVLVATLSPTFPTTPGAFDTTFTGSSESAVVKLNAAGSGLLYSTFLGGGRAAAIALDGDGAAWLAGTAGVGAPTTDGQPNAGGNDAWIGRLDPTGSGLTFAAYLGGTGNDNASAIDLGPDGGVHVAGTTMSADFPTTAGAFDRTWAGDPSIFWGDAFVSGLTADPGTEDPGDPVPQLASVTLAPSSVPGGDPSTGTVTLEAAAPEGGVSIGLSSSTTAMATVPASVTVPEGATTATFTVSTSGVSTDGSVTIVAALGETTRTAVLAVTAPSPAVALSSLALDPTSVTGGDNSTGTVTLSGSAPAGGTTVALNSSNTAVATVPSTVTVPAGASAATFTVSTLAQDFDQSSAISAGLGDATRAVILSVAPGAGGSEESTFSGRVDRNRTVTHTVSMGPGPVDVRLQWTESRADVDLRVRDADGNVVFSNTGSARPKTGSFSVTVAGDHRFEVVNTSRRSTGYTLTVTHPGG